MIKLFTLLLALTPAELAVEKASAGIQKQPAHAPYYNELAAAYVRRARETASDEYFGMAEQSLRKSFALAPDNYEGRKVKAAIEFGRHEYAKALATATALNEKVPDDIAVYGLLADIHTALGNDADAAEATQWMLDLRPGNAPGLIRAARLREKRGNLPGALELLKTAYASTSEFEVEDRAWLLTRMAQVHLQRKDLATAEASTAQALAAFPHYPFALAVLAEIRSLSRQP